MSTFYRVDFGFWGRIAANWKSVALFETKIQKLRLSLMKINIWDTWPNFHCISTGGLFFIWDAYSPFLYLIQNKRYGLRHTARNEMYLKMHSIFQLRHKIGFFASQLISTANLRYTLISKLLVSCGISKENPHPSISRPPRPSPQNNFKKNQITYWHGRFYVLQFPPYSGAHHKRWRINPNKEAQTMFNFTDTARTMMCCRMLYSRACTMAEEQVRSGLRLEITR